MSPIFNDLLEKYIVNVQGSDVKIIESSEQHVIFDYSLTIETFSLDDELTKKMKELHSCIDFVARYEYKSKTSGSESCNYMLFFDNGYGARILNVMVDEIDGELLFDFRTSQENKALCNNFVSEIKKLQKYRLFIITQ